MFPGSAQPQRLVLDTAVLVSRLLKPQSIPGQLVTWALHHAVVLVAQSTIAELVDVLNRPKFAAYIDRADSKDFVQELLGVSEWVTVTIAIQACRDPGDDQFLALAVAGQADAIISSDEDLLTLHPFHGIPIQTPRVYWDQIDHPGSN